MMNLLLYFNLYYIFFKYCFSMMNLLLYFNLYYYFFKFFSMMNLLYFNLYYYFFLILLFDGEFIIIF